MAQPVYSFDHGDLNAKVESVDDSSPEWRLEKVSYAAAYGGERIPAYLFLPKNAKPPYQVVVVFPGANACTNAPAPMIGDRRHRVQLHHAQRPRVPLSRSTRARSSAATPSRPLSEHERAYRDHMIMWAKDVGRSVDYLESRPDIAKDKIGYIGFSWGAELAPLFLRSSHDSHSA